MVGAAVHKVERNVERVDVRVVAIVYERASVLSFLHLQAHGHRLKQRHALRERVGRQSEMTSHHGTGY